MASFDPKHPSLTFSRLKDSVVVVTKGATGIGAEIVRKFHSHGARVIFGDVNEKLARKVVDSTSADTVHFLKTDLHDSRQNFALFEFALRLYGRVDHAVAVSSIIEQSGRVDPKIETENVQAGSLNVVLDTNLKAVAFFAHAACAYLAPDSSTGPRDKSLTILSSIACWKDYPQLFAYPASKYGFLGLMRSLKAFVPAACPRVRVNAICIGLTDTGAAQGTHAGWNSINSPVNTPSDIANIVAAVSAAGQGTETVWHNFEETTGKADLGTTSWSQFIQRGLNGRTVHVMGGECY